MKTRLLAFAAMAALTITACKKSSKDDDSNVNRVDLATEATNHADDQSRVGTEMEAVDNDINVFVENNVMFGRELQTASLLTQPCNVTPSIDSTATSRRLTLTFNGLNCAGTHRRQGTIVVTMPLNRRWRDSGTVLSVAVNNLQITRVRDTQTITVNGTRQLLNATGGLPRFLPIGQSIRHELTGQMTITFPGGSQRVWNVARRRTYSRPNGPMIITVTGMHTDGTLTGISEWGSNRYGNPFVTQIIEPLRMSSECGFRLGQGQVRHSRLAATVDVTFGLNAQGNPTSCPGPAQPYFFKAVWTGAGGNTQTVIRPYY